VGGNGCAAAGPASPTILCDVTVALFSIAGDAITEAYPVAKSGITFTVSSESGSKRPRIAVRCQEGKNSIGNETGSFAEIIYCCCSFVCSILIAHDR
jgi:hypothetical protein